MASIIQSSKLMYQYPLKYWISIQNFVYIKGTFLYCKIQSFSFKNLSTTGSYLFNYKYRKHSAFSALQNNVLTVLALLLKYMRCVIQNVWLCWHYINKKLNCRRCVCLVGESVWVTSPFSLHREELKTDSCIYFSNDHYTTLAFIATLLFTLHYLALIQYHPHLKALYMRKGLALHIFSLLRSKHMVELRQVCMQPEK